jgi:hypothetical protein
MAVPARWQSSDRDETETHPAVVHAPISWDRSPAPARQIYTDIGDAVITTVTASNSVVIVGLDQVNSVDIPAIDVVSGTLEPGEEFDFKVAIARKKNPQKGASLEQMLRKYGL